MMGASEMKELGIAVEPYFAAEAKERMQVRKGNQPGATVANVPHLSKAKSRDQAAAAVGLSR